MDQIFWKGLAPSNEKELPEVGRRLFRRRPDVKHSEHGVASTGLEAQHAKSLTTRVTTAHEGNHQNAGFVILRVPGADCGQRPASYRNKRPPTWRPCGN